MNTGRVRIAVGGIHIESSTFSPHTATIDDFTVTRGDDLLGRYARLSPGAEWVPLVHARALPGGVVDRGFYDELTAELVDRLRAERRREPLDGVYLDIHGAMSVVGLRDAEADVAARVREVVGPGVLVSASMDPHGNVSRELASCVDLLTSHRMSPHEDAELTRERAMDNLVACLRDGVRPVRAWTSVPVLLPGEKACTRDEPAAGVYGSLAEVERLDGVVDAAVWIGYAWADEPRCRGAVVVSGTDETVVAAQAEALAQRWWAAGDDFAFSTRAASLDDAIEAALTSRARPFLVSDSGDNPTAGGSGDVAFGLSRLLADPRLVGGDARAIWASVVAPAAVDACLSAGVGQAVDVMVGGDLGWRGTAPVRLRGTVTAVDRDDPVAGDAAVVRSGGVSAVLTRRRKPFHHVDDFLRLGLDPAAHDVTVVKVGYLVPDLFDAAADWVLALTPGGVDQDIVRLGHRDVARPLYPLDAFVSEPDLTVEVFGSG